MELEDEAAVGVVKHRQFQQLVIFSNVNSFHYQGCQKCIFNTAWKMQNKLGS
jgi:hypothetical protein